MLNQVILLLVKLSEFSPSTYHSIFLAISSRVFLENFKEKVISIIKIRFNEAMLSELSKKIWFFNAKFGAFWTFLGTFFPNDFGYFPASIKQEFMTFS